MTGQNLTAERVRALLNYDPETGVFTNRTPRKKIRVGEVAGCLDKESGYWILCIDRRRYYAHRVAHLYMTGEWPEFMIDHRDGVRSNNVFLNLRDASRRVNQQNMRRALSGSASGLIGAHKKRNKWSSQIRVEGGLIKLGVFATAQAAHDAYVKAKRQYHAGCTI